MKRSTSLHKRKLVAPPVPFSPVIQLHEESTDFKAHTKRKTIEQLRHSLWLHFLQLLDPKFPLQFPDAWSEHACHVAQSTTVEQLESWSFPQLVTIAVVTHFPHLFAYCYHNAQSLLKTHLWKHVCIRAKMDPDYQRFALAGQLPKHKKELRTSQHLLAVCVHPHIVFTDLCHYVRNTEHRAQVSGQATQSVEKTYARKLELKKKRRKVSEPECTSLIPQHSTFSTASVSPYSLAPHVVPEESVVDPKPSVVLSDQIFCDASGTHTSVPPQNVDLPVLAPELKHADCVFRPCDSGWEVSPAVFNSGLPAALSNILNMPQTVPTVGLYDGLDPCLLSCTPVPESDPSDVKTRHLSKTMDDSQRNRTRGWHRWSATTLHGAFVQLSSALPDLKSSHSSTRSLTAKDMEEQYLTNCTLFEAQKHLFRRRC